MPLWIWCVWIPQLLTALIRDEASKVRSILLHISTVYPQALYYTLRAFLLEKRELPLSPQKDEEESEEEGKKKKKRLDSVKYAEDLMARLRSYHPALASEIERMLEEIIVKFKPAPQEELESAVHALLSKCFQLPMMMSSSSKNGVPESLQNTLRRVCVKFFGKETSKKSERHREFVAKYKKPFERDLYPVNNARFPKTLDEVVRKLNVWKSILTRRVRSEPNSVSMGKLSTYLEGFRSNVVEIPGLYNTSSDSEPRPKLHPRLQSFSQRVEILHSNGYSSRRLGVIGSDGKRYHFLVQFAVPSLTRQDERMCQLRVIVNRLMNRSDATRSRHLSFHVDSVVPITPRVRLVSDRKSHASLIEMMESTLGRGCGEDLVLKFRDALRRSQGDRRAAYEEIKTFVPDTLMLRYLLERSSTDEPSFFLLRQEMAKHIGLLSFLCSVMRIGGRNPDRIFVNCESGRVLTRELRPNYSGKDGSMYNLAESVPFRLTRNLTRLLGPTLVDGTMRASMGSVAICLSERRDLMKNYLSLFIRDDMVSYTRSKSATQRSEREERVAIEEMRPQVTKNAEAVMSRIEALRPELDRTEGKELDSEVVSLIQSASNEDDLCQMPSTWHAWL